MWSNTPARPETRIQSKIGIESSKRRSFKLIRQITFASLSLGWFHVPPSLSFDNAVRVVKVPKTNGPKPTNLGQDKKGLLRMCMKPSPNCFSTTPDATFSNSNEDDDEEGEEDNDNSLANGIEDLHTIPRWKFTKGTPNDAFKAIGSMLEQYEPGQSDIDGGGFKIVTRDERKRYYYIQFESLKRGYIDDVEIAVDDDNSVQVVSSSRLGYLDYQVNAKRLNYISSQLRHLGFDSVDISPKTHPVYFESNVLWDGPGLGLGTKKY